VIRLNLVAVREAKVQNLLMSAAEIANAALDLPAEERLELARSLVESVVTPASLRADVDEGIQRIEDVLKGKTKALTEVEFRAALA
jgi:hypothetical protein